MLLYALPIDGTITPQVTTTNNMQEANGDYMCMLTLQIICCIFVEKETTTVEKKKLE